MEKKTVKIPQILCIVLAAALLLSLLALVSAKSDATQLEEQVRMLNEHIQTLELQNQAMQTQLEASGIFEDPMDFDDMEEDGDYSTLTIDSWLAADGKLTVSGYVYVGMFSDTLSGAQLELWRGDAVLHSIPLTLEIGEAEDVYEGELIDVSFAIPEIGSDEELQLWLVVEPANGNPVFTCGAGWYLENGRLMLITG